LLKSPFVVHPGSRMFVRNEGELCDWDLLGYFILFLPLFLCFVFFVFVVRSSLIITIVFLSSRAGRVCVPIDTSREDLIRNFRPEDVPTIDTLAQELADAGNDWHDTSMQKYVELFDDVCGFEFCYCVVCLFCLFYFTGHLFTCSLFLAWSLRARTMLSKRRRWTSKTSQNKKLSNATSLTLLVSWVNDESELMHWRISRENSRDCCTLYIEWQFWSLQFGA
jgi:hypothetical protein